MKKTWTDERNEYMQRHYAKEGPQHCADALGLSIKSVYHQAQRLGLKATTGRGCTILTPDQVRYIRANPKGETFEALGKRFGVAMVTAQQAYHGTTHNKVI